MREFWRALKRLGSLNHPPASVPNMVRDESESLQHGPDPAPVRKRWLECWSRLAERKVDDSRFDQQMHEWVQNRLLEKAEPTEEEMASIPSEQLDDARSLNNPITIAEVEASDTVSRLQEGKAVGCDGICIPAELLTQ